MNILYKRFTLFAVIIFVCSLFAIAACSNKSEEPKPKSELTAVLNGSNNFSWNSEGRFLTITSAEDWTISISYPQGAQSGWCSVSVSAGTANKSVWISTVKNNSSESREATITVKSEHYTVPIEIFQSNINDVIPVEVQKHVELPKIEDPEWLLDYNPGEFIIEYSIIKKHPKWVAWRLHHGNIGSSGRTDAWQFDPRIPSAYSPLREDFTSTSYNNRGHLCPSADRTFSREMNAQTFMYSNMSPQMGDFNGGIWGTLETKVRGWVNGADTLYICAGGTILKESDIIAHTTPSSMAIPKYYFKVILRKKPSGTYDAIGFWFEHRKYTESLSVAHAKTIDEIETLTGLDFFYYLPADVQNTVEATFNPSSWGL
ncbi:MAG: DNA/RNA non-specific endonuclease [Prevotellaceae bacterium]|jgi:endonuclease G|nr:DNA/RNA non-specific endonuclease [Prevotellaceae bacterium]